MPRDHRRPAFSLLELVAVLAIIALLASMALPRFGAASGRYRADAAARRVMVDLEYLRDRAKHSSSNETAIFDAARERYQLSGISDPDHPGSSYEVSLAEAPYHATILSASFNGDAKIVFDGRGMPVGIEGTAGTVVLEVGDEIRTVVLDGDTGELVVLGTLWAPGDPVDEEQIIFGDNLAAAFGK